MAIKGLSIPVIGDYSKDDGGQVSYSNAAVYDHAVEYGITVNSSDDNPLYADNGIQEQDSGVFQNGELSLKTADLTPEISKRILNVKEESVTFGKSKTAKILVYDDEVESPYLGWGIIELHQIDNKDKYRAVFLPKIKFNIPEEAATTKGESVEWQTKSVTASILRSDESTGERKHPWKIEAWFDTESEAIEFLLYMCGKREE